MGDLAVWLQERGWAAGEFGFATAYFGGGGGGDGDAWIGGVEWVSFDGGGGDGDGDGGWRGAGVFARGGMGRFLMGWWWPWERHGDRDEVDALSVKETFELRQFCL